MLRRGIGHGAVATIIEAIMTIGAVSAHIGAVGIGVRRVWSETSVNLGMACKIDEYACEPAGVEIRRDRISTSGFLDGGAVCQHV